jgi:hypothetical protein
VLRSLTSTVISKISAGLLLLGGISFLFASDVILPAIAPEIPPASTWLGELIGAGWLALAALNWLSRASVLGGVYGRPVVISNLAAYFITAMVFVRVALDNSGHRLPWVIAVPWIVLAGLYGWLLLRGPFHRDMPNS